MLKAYACIIWADKVPSLWTNRSIIIFYRLNGHLLNCLILKVPESPERDWSDTKYILNLLQRCDRYLGVWWLNLFVNTRYGHFMLSLKNSPKKVLVSPVEHSVAACRSSYHDKTCLEDHLGPKSASSVGLLRPAAIDTCYRAIALTQKFSWQYTVANF